MAFIPKMDRTSDVVGLIAAVLDTRDGATRQRAREMGHRVGLILAEDPADFVTTMGFVGAALAELAGEAIGIPPEEVLAVVLTAGTSEEAQEFEVQGDDDEDGAAEL